MKWNIGVHSVGQWQAHEASSLIDTGSRRWAACSSEYETQYGKVRQRLIEAVPDLYAGAKHSEASNNIKRLTEYLLLNPKFEEWEIHKESGVDKSEGRGSRPLIRVAHIE